MRVLAAIACSLLLVVSQALAALAPLQAPAAARPPVNCCGCGCAQPACCATSQNAPRPASNPSPQALSAQRGALAGAPVVARTPTPPWTGVTSLSLPCPAAIPAALPARAPLPLFRQHCALLL